MPPVDDRLHRLGKFRIERTVAICAELPHSHVTPQLLLAIFDRETLLQNIVGSGDDDTGIAQLNRRVWKELLERTPGCPGGSWSPVRGKTAASPGYCPTFDVSARTAHGIILSHVATVGREGVPWPERLYVAVAGYNAGISGALRGWHESGNPDKYTAAPRHDYSRDVIETRRPLIEAWLRDRDFII